jgi:hypothetical protein
MSGIDAYTVLMLHMDGVDTSTTFTDSELTPKTVTANGNAQIDTAQSKFGGASGLFDGTGDYLSLADSADWYFGTGDFTIDFWVRFNALPALNEYTMIYSQYQDTYNRLWFGLRDISEAKWWELGVMTGGALIIQVRNSTTVAVNTWYHVVLVRSGTSWYLFQDGAQLSTPSTEVDAVPDLASLLYLASYGGTSFYLNGRLDEFRISKGVARWTSNFTPPTRAYSYLDKEVLGVADANIGAISFGGSDILEANIRDIIYG